MKKIDLDTWPRAKHYNLYKNFDYPHFNVAVRMDVTHFYKYVKQNYIPFYNGMIFAVMKHINNIEELRTRIRNDEVVLHDIVHPSFTILVKDDLYSFCHSKYNSNPFEFIKNLQASVKEVGNEANLDDPENRDDSIYITSIPWIDFTSITHPINMNPVDSVPRVAWGRYVLEHEKYMMTMSLQVHHGLTDGIHVASFFEHLQRELWSPDDLFDIF